jgi:plastocyanin
MYRKLTVLLAVLALAVFGLAACGDDDEDTGADTAATTEEAVTEEAPADDEAGGGGSDTFAISADAGGALAYDTTDATVGAGTVTIDFDNPSSVPHDVVIEGPDGDIGGTEVITDSSAEATVELEPGSYTFYCSVSGHREAGMEGTLEVE